MSKGISQYCCANHGCSSTPNIKTESGVINYEVVDEKKYCLRCAPIKKTFDYLDWAFKKAMKKQRRMVGLVG